MARISTYQHDAMPHVEDNVIGTNQSPGHANETVLFRIGAIEELIRQGLFYTQTFTRSNYDNGFYSDLTNLITTDTTSTIPEASVTFTHGLENRTPGILLVLTEFPIVVNESGVAEFAESIDHGQVPSDNVAAPYTVNYVDDNNIQIVFDFKKVYSGTVIILG